MRRGGKRLVIFLALLAVAALLVITWRMGDAPPQPQITVPATVPETTGAAAATAGNETTPPATAVPPATTAASTSAPPAAEPETTAPPTTTAPQTTEEATEAATHPLPADDTPVGEVQLSCTLVIRCDTLLDNMDNLAEEKRELVPENGVLLEVTASFYQGESVLHVLAREARRAGLHLEYTNTPGYRSAYIQGIGNLYQYDCGALSGWVYAVNGWFPGYGCSRYVMEEGDTITFAYTCDMGVDVGGNNEFEAT